MCASVIGAREYKLLTFHMWGTACWQMCRIAWKPCKHAILRSNVTIHAGKQILFPVIYTDLLCMAPIIQFNSLLDVVPLTHH